MNQLELLGEFLSSNAAHPDAMGLSDLDGFLAGVVCCPEPLPVKEWLDHALGDMSGVPDSILRIVTGIFEENRDRLEVGLPLEPVFWQNKEGTVIAMDWCEGFMDAVALRPERWDSFSQTKTGSELMMPILVHMFDDDGNSLFGIPQEDLDTTLGAAAEAISVVVPAIFRHIRVITQN